MICELMCICATIIAVALCLMGSSPHNHDHHD